MPGLLDDLYSLAPAGRFRQWSTDAFKSWSRCRRQFYYKHVKAMQWPADQSNFRLGRDVHKLLDYQARGLDCDLLVSGAPEDVRRSWTKLMAHPITQLPVLANEWAFHVPIALGDQLPGLLEEQRGNNGRVEWLTGRIDRVARDGDRLLVIDWKTGTAVPPQPEADWQTMIYRYAVVEVASSPSAADLGFNLPKPGQENAAASPLRPEQVTFVYVEVKADESTPIRPVEITYSAEEHAKVAQLLRDTLTWMLSEEDYVVTDPCPDRFCAFRPICGVAG